MSGRSAPAAAPLTVVVAALTTVLVLLGGSSAQAHNGLRSTAPADGEQVATPPTAVTLEFDQPALAVGTAVVVTAADGRVVSEGDPALVDATVTQAVSGVSAGAYEVAWRVTSADGHPISGTFSFSVAAGTPSAASPSASATGATAAGGTGTPTATEPPEADEGDTAAAASSSPDESGGSGVGVLLVAGAVLVVLVGGGVVALRRRSPQGPSGQD